MITEELEIQTNKNIDGLEILCDEDTIIENIEVIKSDENKNN